MTPISAIGDRRDTGFTLTELLVVVAIMGLLANAVLLSAPYERRSLMNEAERFAARLVRAKEQAVLTGRTVEVRITEAGYGFDIRRAGARVAIEEPPFSETGWERYTTVVFADAGKRSRISFDSTGLATPTNIDLYREDSRVHVSVDAGGRVRIDAPAR